MGDFQKGLVERNVEEGTRPVGIHRQSQSSAEGLGSNKVPKCSEEVEFAGHAAGYEQTGRLASILGRRLRQ